MQKFILLVVVFLSILFTTNAQYEKLDSLKGHSVNIFFSKGHVQRASAIADLVDSAMKYYGSLLQFTPVVDLLILSVKDWTSYTSMPVLGMPHYDNNDNRKLVIAAEDNELWQSFTPPLDKLDLSLAEQIRKTYGKKDGSVTMEAFFDLLALHELAHAFHIQAGINMQRKWMSELFVNMMLHNFVAEKRPHLLPALTVFPRMVVEAGSSEYIFKKLADIDERYQEIGSRHPKNYGWFQCRWHMASGTIYHVAGEKAAMNLWAVLKHQPKKLSDDAFLALLHKADPSIATVVRDWDADTR